MKTVPAERQAEPRAPAPGRAAGGEGRGGGGGASSPGKVNRRGASCSARQRGAGHLLRLHPGVELVGRQVARGGRRRPKRRTFVVGRLRDLRRPVVADVRRK